MPRFIAKLADDEYVDWSTVVDAPVTDVLTREQMAAYMLREYGEFNAREIEPRLARTDKNGHSAMWGKAQNLSVEEMILPNRAGEGESSLTMEELRRDYKEEG